MILREYYIQYLKNIRKLSDASVRHYLSALNQIEIYLRNKEKGDFKFFDIIDIEDLKEIRNFLFQDFEFVEKNKRGHRMYSKGFDNYFEFVQGDKFNTDMNQSDIFDFILPRGKLSENKQKVWKRSRILKGQAIQMAKYKCEINGEHRTFISRTTNKPYMEGHHIIPMCNQTKFGNSLDVYSNIICLCPVCHKMLHYGKNNERILILKKIYDNRYERLHKCGIE